MKTQILIVGDDSHLALALQTVLLDKGYTVQVHESGEEERIEWNDSGLILVINISQSSVEVSSPNWPESILLNRPVDTGQLLALADRAIGLSISQNLTYRTVLESRSARWESRSQSTSVKGQFRPRPLRKDEHHTSGS